MIKCKPGNKPCGKRCIPNKWECDKDGMAKKPKSFGGLKKYQKTLITLALVMTGVSVASIIYHSMKDGKQKKVSPQPEVVSPPRKLPPTDINVLREIKNSPQEATDLQIKKDLDNAIMESFSVEQLSKKYQINPKILAKVPKDLQIHAVDANSEVFKNLGIDANDLDAAYFSPYDKLVFNPASDNLSEGISRELIFWHQNNVGYVMSDQEYENAMNNLTPIQNYLLTNVENHFRKTWKEMAISAVWRKKSDSIGTVYESLKRSTFESYYLSSDWDKLAKQIDL